MVSIFFHIYNPLLCNNNIVANRILSRCHELNGKPLNLKTVQKIPQPENETVTILLKNISPEFQPVTLELCVQDIHGVSISDIENGCCKLYFPPLPFRGKSFM